MTEAEVDRWRAQFQPPDDAEAAGDGRTPVPVPWDDWSEWAAQRWPSLSQA